MKGSYSILGAQLIQQARAFYLSYKVHVCRSKLQDMTFGTPGQIIAECGDFPRIPWRSHESHALQFDPQTCSQLCYSETSDKGLSKKGTTSQQRTDFSHSSSSFLISEKRISGQNDWSQSVLRGSTVFFSCRQISQLATQQLMTFFVKLLCDSRDRFDDSLLQQQLEVLLQFYLAIPVAFPRK